MRFEFIMLGCAILLALVHIGWAGQARTRQYGTDWNTGARDQAMPPLAPLAARLQRAQANLFETLPLFMGALLGAAACGHLGWQTQVGSGIYVAARVIYLPLYAAGVPVVRTLVWLVSMAGLMLILWALMLG